MLHFASREAARVFAGTRILRVYMFIRPVNKWGRVVLEQGVQFLSFKDDIAMVHPINKTETDFEPQQKCLRRVSSWLF